MKKSIITIIAIFIMGIVFSGCAGKNFSFNDAKAVEVGDSKETVVQKMGSKPYAVHTERVNGELITKYVYVHSNGFTGNTKSVSFILKNDKVSEVPYISDELLKQ